MACIVKKFGGSSVADIEKIGIAARRVRATREQGYDVAVIVSAMGDDTDKLVDLTKQATRVRNHREYDNVVAAGEQISAGLMAMVLTDMGIPARSWLGWQLPIRTDGAHAAARIHDIETEELRQSLDRGEVAVIAGFQGLGPDGRVTTMGRGGSDTTAVAIAAALKAERCDIYTDVDGVYTSDPRIVAKARKLDKITYEEMLEMASQGAKVLQTRSVEIAMKYRVPVRVLSSFGDGEGTLLVDEDQLLEQSEISGITYSVDEAQITLVKVADRPGVAARIFGPLADANVNVDMIVQNISDDGKATDLTFTVTREDLDKALAALEAARDDIGYAEIESDRNVVKISVIGVGMRSHAGTAQKMFAALAEKAINIKVISTSEIKISVLIASDYTELALRTLHTAYGLDED